MDIRPIRNAADYEATLKIVSDYFNQEPQPGTEDADRFEILVTRIEDWERKHYPIDLPAADA